MQTPNSNLLRFRVLPEISHTGSISPSLISSWTRTSLPVYIYMFHIGTGYATNYYLILDCSIKMHDFPSYQYYLDNCWNSHDLLTPEWDENLVGHGFSSFFLIGWRLARESTHFLQLQSVIHLQSIQLIFYLACFFLVLYALPLLLSTAISFTTIYELIHKLYPLTLSE